MHRNLHYAGRMEFALIALLALNVVFNIAVWPRFASRVNADPRACDEQGNPTKFLRVHQVLFAAAAVVTLLSLAGAVVGVLVL